jgi:peptide/nickel transport system substrate-binding protein
MKKFLMTLSVTVSLTASLVGTATTSGGASSGPSTILTEETNVGQIFTNNFNPADSQSTSTQMSLNGLSFEPLIMFNPLKVNDWSPWLALKETFNSTGQRVTFTINPLATWSNGAKLTAQHVANEFNAMSNNASLNVFGLPSLAQPATASGNQVTLTYATPQFSNEQAIGSVLIFPVPGDKGLPASSIITSGTVSLSNNHVVGNGPYLPTRYTGQLISYTANSHWKLTPKPYVTGVNIPYYASNQAATQALVAHQLDWAGNDIPQITRTFVAMDPKHNHYYYPAGSTVTLWFNLSPSAPNGQTSCLADPAFRNVVSMAINRNQLSVIGESGFEQPATSTSGLTPLQAPYLGSFRNNINTAGWTSSQVSTAMRAAGYTLNAKGYFQVTGAQAQDATGLAAKTECHFTIQDPVSYSDYAEDMQLISAHLKAVHINVTAQGVSTGQWNANIATHNFDSIIRWGAGGTNPYSQYQNWLADPANTGGSTNFGGYVNPAAQRALVQLAAARPGTPAFQTNVTKLATIMTNDVPVAPLLYGADWDVYSTLRFKGWVTAANPYAYPGPAGNSLAFVITKLKKS